MKISNHSWGVWILMIFSCVLKHSGSEFCTGYSLDFIDPNSVDSSFCTNNLTPPTDPEDSITKVSPTPPTTEAPTPPAFRGISPQVRSLRATVAYLTSSCLSQALYLRWRLQNKYPTIKPPCTNPCLYQARPKDYQHKTRNFTAKIQEDYWTTNNYLKFYRTPDTQRVISHAGIDQGALQDLATKTQVLKDRLASLLVVLDADPRANPTWTPDSSCYRVNLWNMFVALDNMEDFLRDYLPIDLQGLGS